MRRPTKSDWVRGGIDLAVVRSCAASLAYILAFDATAVISVPSSLDRRRRNRVVRRALKLDLRGQLMESWRVA